MFVFHSYSKRAYVSYLSVLSSTVLYHLEMLRYIEINILICISQYFLSIFCELQYIAIYCYNLNSKFKRNCIKDIISVIQIGWLVY